jgi:hypothetical protein
LDDHRPRILCLLGSYVPGRGAGIRVRLATRRCETVLDAGGSVGCDCSAAFVRATMMLD